MVLSRFRSHEVVSPTIYSFVEAHLDPSGVGLTSGGDELPDTQPRGVNEIGWAPGAFDGVVTHHMGKSGGSSEANAIFALIGRTISRDFRSADFGKLYELVRTSDVVGAIDPLLNKVRSSALPVSGIRQLGRRLAMESRHREPVKLGIALLGLITGDPDRDILFTLGRHDEFTLYAAVALANTEPDSDRDRVLMELANTVNGWGRVHIVERLAGTSDPQVKSWLLRGGFRNSIMAEYTAHIAATTGELESALAADDVDDPLIDAAAEIISALINGGPAEDIYDYADGPRAVERFVTHVETRPRRLPLFVAIHDISHFLEREDERERMEAAGWTAELRAQLAARCSAIKADPEWVSLAIAGLDSEDMGTFYDADRTARELGIDTFPAHWKRLQADPIQGSWFWVMHKVDEAHLHEVLDLARRTLPLADLGGGPKATSAADFRAHTALEFVVTGLKRFPGQAPDLVMLGLNSPVIRSRNMAINTLTAWTPAAWSPEIRTAVQHALTVEPDDKVRERLATLLAP